MENVENVENVGNDQGDSQMMKEPKQEQISMDDIAYFVITKDKMDLINDAMAVIPNPVAKKAVVEAIEGALIPVTNDAVEKAKQDLQK